jgi:hypothetical protein
MSNPPIHAAGNKDQSKNPAATDPKIEPAKAEKSPMMKPVAPEKAPE